MFSFAHRYDHFWWAVTLNSSVHNHQMSYIDENCGMAAYIVVIDSTPVWKARVKVITSYGIPWYVNTYPYLKYQFVLRKSSCM